MMDEFYDNLTNTGKKRFIKAVVAQANVANRNGMMYSEEALKKAAEDFHSKDIKLQYEELGKRLVSYGELPEGALDNVASSASWITVNKMGALPDKNMALRTDLKTGETEMIPIEEAEKKGWFENE